MSLFGSLFTGVSALGAQSQTTAMISNNIANVNTVGFKRSEAAFFSLVTSESRSTRYSPGTVSVNRIQRVDQQGPIQQSVSSTDVAVSGNGFFAVKRDTNSGGTSEYLYTRNGQFSENAQGLLQNSAGFYLYGWPLDTDGNLPAAQGDLSSLVPVDVAFLGGLTRPTTSAELSVNLNANAADETLTSALTAAVDFSRGLRVFDSLGSAQDLTLEFTKIYGPQATMESSLFDMNLTDTLVGDLNLNSGDQFTIQLEVGVLRTYDVGVASGGDVTVTTVQDIIDDIKTNLGAAADDADAFLNDAGQLVIQRSDFTGGAANTLTFANVGAGTALNDLGITAGVYTSDDLSAGGVYDNGDPADVPAYSTGGFPPFQYYPGDVTYNSRGWWQMNIVMPDGSTQSRGLMNFNGDGTINALEDSDGEIDIDLNNIDWGNGAELQDIEIDVERFSQFAGAFDVIYSDQNGAELGLRTGVEIDRNGYVIAQFSNGASAELYKLPLVTFANSNGLTEISGTAYTETEESGEENLREAGNGGAGFLETSTLENSNVDLADEFAKLIITQRAYSAGTKVINTVDQMTEELLRLR